MKDEMKCPFCEFLGKDQLLAENEHAYAFRDAFPVSKGHTLVVPKRHDPDFLSICPERNWR